MENNLPLYCALHLIQALAKKRGVEIGSRHHEMLLNMNPKNTKRTLQVKKNIFEAYDSLFEYSRTSRYNGITDPETFESIKKADYNYALKSYNYIKSYVLTQGIDLT